MTCDHKLGDNSELANFFWLIVSERFQGPSKYLMVDTIDSEMLVRTLLLQF